MERLTRTDISMAINILSNPQSGDESDIRKAVADAIEAMRELQKYKDLEEQGRLICLPCKIGDIVYVADKTGRRVHPFTIDIIEMNKFDKSILASYIGKEQNLQYWKIRISIERFEEHFCKTKEEAKAKLKKLKEGVE